MGNIDSRECECFGISCVEMCERKRYYCFECREPLESKFNNYCDDCRIMVNNDGYYVYKTVYL